MSEKNISNQKSSNKAFMVGLLLLFVLSSSAYANEWFFYPYNGVPCTSETCNGTQEHPWRFHPLTARIGAVDASVIQPGDTLYICGDHGHFNLDDRVVLDIPNLLISGLCPDGSRGVLTSYLTLRSNATGNIVQDLILRGPGVGPTGFGQGVALAGADDVTLSRLSISGWQRGIMCTRQSVCDNIIIENSTIQKVGQGIEKFVYSGETEDKNWIIRYNKFYDVGISFPYGDGEAIGIQGIDGLHIYGNQISYAKIGINMWTQDKSYIRNVKIEGNHLEGIQSAPCSWPSRGIMRSNKNTVADVFENIVIRYNVIYNTGAQAIRMFAADGATGNIISHNIIGETGLECSADPIWAVGAWSQEHNMISTD